MVCVPLPVGLQERALWLAMMISQTKIYDHNVIILINLTTKILLLPALMGRRHAQQKYNINFNKDLCHVSCTCVTMSILPFHVCTTLPKALVMWPTAQLKTAAVMVY